MRNACLGLLLIGFLFITSLHELRAQVPYLTAVSLDTGSITTSSNSGARSIGNVTCTSTSQTTTGILAVKIQLRTLGKLLVEAEKAKSGRLINDSIDSSIAAANRS